MSAWGCRETMRHGPPVDATDAGTRPGRGPPRATPLELFFDLCFVVAVAQAAASLHHALAERHPARPLVGYPMVFFAIWWAWMNFTWFASAYDTDDVVYRLATFVQIAGVLILAAGVPRAFDDQRLRRRDARLRGDARRAGRRSGCGPPAAIPTRRAPTRYAIGVSVCMVGWIAAAGHADRLAASAFVVMVVAELLVPVWAERPARRLAPAPHRRALRLVHVDRARRVGAGGHGRRPVRARRRRGARRLASVAFGGLLIVFSMWWLYFSSRPTRRSVGPRAVRGRACPRLVHLGLRPLFVFASAAAVGEGIAAVVDAVHPPRRDLGAGRPRRRRARRALRGQRLAAASPAAHPAAHVSPDIPLSGGRRGRGGAHGRPGRPCGCWAWSWWVPSLVTTVGPDSPVRRTIEVSRLVSRAPPVESDKRYEPVS